MNTHIRALLGGALAAIAGALAATPALAQQDYPNRAIRVIHGYPVGGGADILGRKFISKMQEASGKTFVMDNKPGNAGNIAVGLGAAAKPDGYTLVIGSSSNMVGAKYFYKDVNFDPVKDFTPIGSFLEGSFVLVVSAQTPFNDLKGFTAWMKERQRAKFAYSNQLGQLAGEYLKARLGVSAERTRRLHGRRRHDLRQTRAKRQSEGDRHDDRPAPSRFRADAHDERAWIRRRGLFDLVGALYARRRRSRHPSQARRLAETSGQRS